MKKEFLDNIKTTIINENIRKVLIIDVDDINFDNIIELLELVDKLCIAVDGFFLRSQLSVKFSKNQKVEIFSSTAIKMYDYDAIICNEVYATTLSVLNSISSIRYVLCASSNVNSILDFTKNSENLFIKSFLMESNQDDFTSAKIKIGFGITTTSSRFNILEKSLRLLDDLAVECQNEYEFVISVYNDESLDKIANRKWKALSKEFPKVVFNSKLLQSIAKAKNASLQPLIEEKCYQYFILDDDVLILDRRAIDYYSKACRDFHFLHLHLMNYLPNEEKTPKLAKQYKDFKVLQYSYDNGCVVVFDNEVIEKCGIWDENFVGWGYEHREFEYRVSKILYNGRFSHLSIPEVYDNNYIISFDTIESYKLDEYKKIDNYISLVNDFKSSAIAYDRNETCEKNLIYIKNIDNKKQVNIVHSIFDNIQVRQFYNKMSRLYEFDKKFKNKKKCIIIGSAPSIYGYHLKDYINNEDAIVFRINRFPNEDIIENVGDKTDFITTWTKLHFDKDDPTKDPRFLIFERELRNDNRNIEHIKKVFKEYYGFESAWTTGFFTILMCMFYFDEIELFGFGFSDEIIKNSRLVSFAYDSHKTLTETSHDFQKEREIVNSFLKEYPNKICRLEDKFINEKIPIDIAMITDENYCKLTMMAINDIILAKHASTRLNFHIFLDNVKKETEEKIKYFNKVSKISIKIYDISNKVEEANEIFKKIGTTTCKSGNYITGTAFIRCMLPELLPTIDKVLYLDQDIFVRSDLSEFFDVKLNEKYLIAVIKDFYSNTYPRSEVIKDTPVPIKNKKYFYAGQMLMNLKELRKFDLNTKCIKFLKETLPYHKEMSALNYYLWDKAKFLDCKWCFSYHCIILKNSKYNINLYNQLYESNYSSMDDLIEKSVIWHFHGNKSDLMKNPTLKTMWDDAEKRLEVFFKYFS